MIANYDLSLFGDIYVPNGFCSYIPVLTNYHCSALERS